jgi:hypothetical protein
MTSFFSQVSTCPPNEILGVSTMAKADQSELKVDLSLGAYRGESGEPVVLPSVRAAEKEIYEANLDHEYLGQDGLASFNTGAQVRVSHPPLCLPAPLSLARALSFALVLFPVFPTSLTHTNPNPPCT